MRRLDSDKKNTIDSLVKKFVRFASVGVLGTVAHYIVLIILVEIVNTTAIVGSSFGFLMGAAVNYTLNYYYTFKSNKQHIETVPKFYLVAALGFLINGLIIYGLAHLLAVNYILSQLVATAIVLVWGFAANYLWTFVEKPA
jgi:putative flippase GtrA